MRKKINFVNGFKLLIVAALSLSGSLCFSSQVSRDLAIPLTTVEKVDLNKYLGRWYEAYRLPNWFEDEDCNTLSADYSLRDDGNIKVINTCYKPNKTDKAEGIAKVADKVTNSKLRVSFFRPFYGDYWIVDLAPDYSWALVGESSGKYFWILTRDQKISPEQDRMLLERAKKLGYITERLIKPANTLPIKN